MLFTNNPILFILLSFSCCGLYLAYGVYVFEREIQPADITYWISIYLVCTALFTGWANDSYEEYIPLTWTARCLLILSVVLGVFWFALLIDYIHSRMTPTAFQKIALEWVSKATLIERERDAAARVIQTVWRYHQWKKTKRCKLSKTDRAAQKEGYQTTFLRHLRALRKIHRDQKRDAKGAEAGYLTDPNRRLKVLLDAQFQDIRKAVVEDISLKLEKQKEEMLQVLMNSSSGESIKPKTEKLEDTISFL